jgi:hypothetical protein
MVGNSPQHPPRIAIRPQINRAKLKSPGNLRGCIHSLHFAPKRERLNAPSFDFKILKSFNPSFASGK